MIVCRDLNFSSMQLLHGMISPVVAELQLVGPSSQRNARKLMAEANSEYRLPSHEPANVLYRIGARLRVTRPVGQKHSMRFQRENILRWSLRWNHSYFAAFAAQLAQNILLD